MAKASILTEWCDPVRSFGEGAGGVMLGWRKNERNPTIAPKVLLQVPLWHDPRSARRRSTMQRQWHQQRDGARCIWAVETTNVFQIHETAGLAYGLLRYLDLDVTMGLSWAFSRIGRRSFEISQADLLHAMGHESLDAVSYAELAASYRRIQNTKIVVAEPGMNIEDATSWQIADYIRPNQERCVRSTTTIDVDLSRAWQDAINSNAWQAVDFDSYVQLARRNRKLGMARVIYLYLASWRDPAGGFRVPIGPILERYAQRRTDGSYRYPDHFREPRSLIYQSLRAIADAGVAEFHAVPEGASIDTATLTGSFKACADPWARMTLQQVAFSPSLVCAPAGDGNACATKVIATEDIGNEHVKLQQERFPDSVKYCEETMLVLADRMDPPCSRRALAEAKRHGWGSQEIWLVLGIAMWLKANTETIKTTAAQYAAGILREGRDNPVYRNAYQRSSVEKRINIDGRELLKWLKRHHLSDHVMPNQRPKAAS